MRILEKLNRFNDEGKWMTWVLGIASNVCHEGIRQVAKSHPSSTNMDDSRADHEDPATPTERQEQQQTVNDALDRLGDRQREAIILRYFESLSFDEVAAVMGTSVGSAKATVHQALKKLRNQFQMDDG